MGAWADTAPKVAPAPKSPAPGGEAAVGDGTVLNPNRPPTALLAVVVVAVVKVAAADGKCEGVDLVPKNPEDATAVVVVVVEGALLFVADSPNPEAESSQDGHKREFAQNDETYIIPKSKHTRG